mmetsp:Transcript_13303/g.26970  ORF Transcript_13303/g.26970 Transcript_13303/m.26970 type:complete len:414 (-) Transcript_13303:56-1297(-)
MMEIVDLINVASLSNHELFTKVIAEISRCFKSRNKKERPNNWMSIAVQIAVAAAEGQPGCASDWVEQFNVLSSDNDTGNNTNDINFSEALNRLNAKECYMKRLNNVLGHPSLSLPNNILSVRHAAGLIRGSVLLSKEDNHNDDTVKGIQISVIKLLVRTMPQLGSTCPCDIFLAVQLPLLQSLDRSAFTNGGLSFPSKVSEQEFDYLLGLDCSDLDFDSVAQVGEKRNRSYIQHSKYTHVLEAAHLARKGAVRAQHGAVIVFPSPDDEIQVIGKGWNHDYLMDRAKTNKNKVVLHSECHAIADAIKRNGEDECFNELFPKATIFIVELESDFAYETCHPCPKCDPLLRAVGIMKVFHTTPNGNLTKMELSTPSCELLANENCSLPLKAACDEQGITCKRLDTAMKEAADEGKE